MEPSSLQRPLKFDNDSSWQDVPDFISINDIKQEIDEDLYKFIDKTNIITKGSMLLSTVPSSSLYMSPILDNMKTETMDEKKHSNKSNILDCKDCSSESVATDEELNDKPFLNDSGLIKSEKISSNNEDKQYSSCTDQEKHEEYKKHKCHVCDYQTNWKSHFNRHLLRHNDPEEVETYNCDKCDYRSSNKYNFQMHVRRQHTFKKVDKRSQRKNKPFKSMSSKIADQEKLENYKKHKCHVCDYETKWKSALYRHLLQHINPENVETFKCIQCDYRSVNKHNLNKHLRAHKTAQSQNRLFRSTSSRYYTDHEQPNKKHKCHVCDFQTKKKSSLTRHLQRHNNPEEVEEVKCDRCDYKSINKHNFMMHLRRHKRSDEREFTECPPSN